MVNEINKNRRGSTRGRRLTTLLFVVFLAPNGKLLNRKNKKGIITDWAVRVLWNSIL